jgi:hypothetical protein
VSRGLGDVYKRQLGKSLTWPILSLRMEASVNPFAGPFRPLKSTHF